MFLKKLRSGWALALVAAVAALVAAPQASLAQDRRSGGPEDVGENATGEDDSLYDCERGRGRVFVNLRPETELKDLVSWAMTFTCKNFVYAANIGSRASKVTIIAPKKMSPRESWRVFLVALQTMNLTVVPKGNVLEVVESPRAKEQPLPVYTGESVASTDQVVRVVVRPENMSVADLSAAFNALKSKDGIVSSLPNAGIIVVTDYGSVINRMLRVKREVDQPVVSERVYIIRVTHADATEMASKLQEIFQQPASKPAPSTSSSRNRRNRRNRNNRNKKPEVKAPTTAQIETAVPSKLIADDRTNTLIMLANEAAYLRVNTLVKYLDVQIEGGAGRIHVYYLENGDAQEMANTLNGVVSGSQQPQQANNRRRPAPQQPSSGGGALGAAFEGAVRVTADTATNSLIIVSSVKDFIAMRDVLSKLDRPRRQVFIEAHIFEVSLDASRELGVSFHGGAPTDGVQEGSFAVGGVQVGSISSLNPASLAGAQGLVGGVIGNTLDGIEELLGVSIPSFGVLIQAVATNNDINLLSAPHIIATDNQEAEISVGENIPFQGAFSGLGALGGAQGGGGIGGLGIPNVSVQRQDVALTLKLTPHINNSDFVRLELDQQIQDIASENFNNLGPSWSNRALKTTVVVKDQETVVIGGLIQDNITQTETKVPLLGDIPILGYLFKSTRKTKTKTNLLVVLTPYIIKDQTDLQRIVERKMRERREFVETFTTFEVMEYDPEIDYRRKRGVIEEINQAAGKLEREADLLRELEQEQIEMPSGAIDYSGQGDDGDGDALPGEGDPRGDDGADPAEDAPAEGAADGEGGAR